MVDSLENAINSVTRDNAAINAFCEALKNSLEKHFEYLLDSAVHQASTALDPRIKLSFTNNTAGKFFKFNTTSVKEKINELLPKSNSPPDSVSTPTTNDDANDSEAQPQRKKRLLDFSSVLVHDTSTSENDVELQAYFDHPTLDMIPLTFLEWTKHYTVIYFGITITFHTIKFCTS